MSVFITKPISGIKIEGLEVDLRPKEPLAGTYEAPTQMNIEIKVDEVPEARLIAKEKPKGKPISGRVWADPEQKTSTLRKKHKPDEQEANYRRGKTLQLRDFVRTRKEEINRKVGEGDGDPAGEAAARGGEEAEGGEHRERQHVPSGRLE